jgi:hypothetical protein
VRGSPIRKSSDQRSVDSSPRLIAASYVLHRLLVPRHPPCALNNLTTQTPTPIHHTTKKPNHHPPERRRRPDSPVLFVDQRGYPDMPTKILLDARVHCAVLKVRKMIAHPTPPAPDNPGGTTPERSLTRRNSRPFPQDPTACLRPAPRAPPRSPPRQKRSRTSSDTRSPAELVSVPPSSSVTNTRASPNGNASRSVHGSGPPSVDGGQCSLERR